jgi:hypothetical protein
VQEELVREYDMPFGFCIPNSVNSWDAEYDMPLYEEEQVNEFVRCWCLFAHIYARILLPEPRKSALCHSGSFDALFH